MFSQLQMDGPCVGAEGMTPEQREEMITMMAEGALGTTQPNGKGEKKAEYSESEMTFMKNFMRQQLAAMEAQRGTNNKGASTPSTSAGAEKEDEMKRGHGPNWFTPVGTAGTTANDEADAPEEEKELCPEDLKEDSSREKDTGITAEIQKEDGKEEEQIAVPSTEKEEKRDESQKEAPKEGEQKESSSSSAKDMGNSAFKCGEYESAVQHYTTAIEESQKEKYDDAREVAKLYTNRSIAHRKASNTSAARDDALKSLQIDPTWQKGYLRLGQAFEDSGFAVDDAEKNDDAKKKKAVEELQFAIGAYLKADATEEVLAAIRRCDAQVRALK